MVVTEKDKKENKVKFCILLSCIGPQGREIFNTFTFLQEGESFAFENFDSVFLFALLSDGKLIESVPIENVQGLRGQISRFS